jgi:hypothetical protein
MRATTVVRGFFVATSYGNANVELGRGVSGHSPTRSHSSSSSDSFSAAHLARSSSVSSCRAVSMMTSAEVSQYSTASASRASSSWPPRSTGHQPGSCVDARSDHSAIARSPGTSTAHASLRSPTALVARKAAVRSSRRRNAAGPNAGTPSDESMPRGRRKKGTLIMLPKSPVVEPFDIALPLEPL